MDLNPSVCYRAVLARDARYDGRFFTCVKTTGIYCRPICPARPPRIENCSFVRTAAAAQAAGFRPCLRCRPESSPDLDAWRGTSATVSRALKMIEGGALDDDGDVASLADRLEIGARQLRRLFRRHLGAAPVTVAQTRRILLARQEIAIRAVLGQQITLKLATQLAGRIVAAVGAPVASSMDIPGLTHAFPRPEPFIANTLPDLGIPKARVAAIKGIAAALVADPHLFDPRRDLDEAVVRLRKLPGVGEWTAQYIAMRALGESDAFLAGDVGVQRRFAESRRRPRAPELLARAERWRPWRAYAVLHLWMADAGSPQTSLDVAPKIITPGRRLGLQNLADCLSTGGAVT